MRHDRGLFPAFVIIAMAVYAMTAQLLLDPIDKGQVGVATDCWKRDQFFQNFNWRKFCDHINIRYPFLKPNALDQLRHKQKVRERIQLYV